MPSPPLIVINKPNLLLVEGRDEELFFMALLNSLNVNEEIQVIQAGGKDQFRAKLKAYMITDGFPGVRRMGIIRDADGNHKGAFDSVCSALRSASLPVPSAVMTLTDGNPRTAVMIMPPEPVEGRNLEDLCLAAVADDPALRCIEAYFDCLTQEEIIHEENRIAKARVHAFLASRAEPDLRLGEAAGKNYWNWDHPAFGPVKDFLRRLTG
jgi:hypothetical protein